MEVMPSKFRSPPPKPPRRRHSEQITMSSTGTYPSRKKYVEENNQYIKGSQTNIDVIRCGSLPANWTNDYTFDQTAENTRCEMGSVLSSSKHKKNTVERLEGPFSLVLDKNSNGLFPEISSKYMHSEKFERSKIEDVPYSDKVTKDTCISKFPLNVEHLDTDDKLVNKHAKHSTSKDEFDLHLPQEIHKRHHSDPVLSFLDVSNFKDVFQRLTFKSHSFLERTSYDRQNWLHNSISPFQFKESQYLLEEMKNLKEINNKLWQQLCSTQAYIEKLEENSDVDAPALSIADLLSSLYCSQQAKDNAMEDRIKVLLEQRNTAVQELEDIVHIIARNFEDDLIQQEEKFSDKEIVTILKEIEVTCNPAKLLQQQRLLLTYLYHAKELKHNHVLHELKLAVTEQNHLLEKVKYLEDQLKRVKVCNEIWNLDSKHWENDLLNIICQVIHQRDVAKKNTTHNFDHLIHRSSPESSFALEPETNDYPFLRDHGDVNKSEVKTKFKPSSNCNQSSTESSLDEIRVLKSELMVLKKAFEIEAEKREKAEENCSRLERLVNVLQKKVNGQNIGIPV